MVCMNLPKHLCYCIKNVYLVGIIPRPSEPKLHHINHLLCPLVDKLLQLWYAGAYYTKTAEHPFGCLIHCAMVILICDTQALKKTLGLPAITSLEGFCSFC
ncbi:hypothetical protein ID866_10747, partial [Astraeus odoratus]